jgi:hypothetical protein
MADFEIRIDDHSGELLKQLNERVKTALEAVGIQAESHAKQIITDTLVYGGIDLMVKGEKDNSRVDTGQLRNSVTHTVKGNDAYIGSNLEYAA